MLVLQLAVLVTVGVAVALPQDLSARQLGGDTQNQLTDGTGCRAVTVLFARGTTETGNVGTLTGPPFFQALSSSVGANNLAVQGVDYPADIPGFLAGGDAQGSKLMASLVNQVDILKTCLASC